MQVLAIAGSNELKDRGINLNLLSWKGIKYGAYKAAQEVHEHFVREPDCPLHRKDAVKVPAGFWYNRKEQQDNS